MSQNQPGRILWSEDFNGGLSNCWSVINNAGQFNSWVWDTLYRPGMHSWCESAIHSTSNSNGFMQLPMDRYNSPMALGVVMDAALQSCRLTIPAVPSISLRFQQKLRYCCSLSNEVVVEISTDGINWTSFDAKQGVLPNVKSADPMLVQMDVSSVLANQNTAYIRFRATGMTHYYWMIDDVDLVETPTNALTLLPPRITYGQFDHLRYAKMPFGLRDTLGFESTVKNQGSSSFSSVTTNLNVDYDTTLTAQGGGVMVHGANSTSFQPLAPDSTMTTAFPNSLFLPTAIGDYAFQFSVTSTPANQNPNWSQDAAQLTITDTVLSKHFAPFLCEKALSDVGSFTGELFHIGGAGGIPTSVTFDIGSYVVGRVEVKAQIWEYTPALSLSQSLQANPVSSSATYALTSADADSRLTLKLITPFTLLPASTYLVGIQIVRAVGIHGFALKQSAPTSALYDTAIHGISFSNTSPAVWSGAYMNQGVSLNFGSLSTAVRASGESSKVDVSIFPNPSNGVFDIRLPEGKQALPLWVRNHWGQEVHHEQLKYQDSRIDLRQFAKGIYFVQIGTGRNQIIEKLVVQ